MDVRAYVTQHADDLLEDLDDWLRIPSISAEPAHAPDVARSAQWLADRLRRAGFPVVEVWAGPWAPAVFAEWPSADPGAPTVLVYGHHDVQPVDPLELWESPPFEPVLRDGEVFARGAADDKGQVLFHLLGLAAHLEAGARGAPAVHLKVLVEGEEESGSPHFADLLREHRERLAPDVVLVSDTGLFAEDVPSVCTSMRGLADAELTLRGPQIDLHSGAFGGAVPNPLHAMAALLAGLHDESGRVTLPGFYDRVRELSRRERELMAALPFDERRWLAEDALSGALRGEAGYSTLERIGARPTCEVNGMWGGYTGPGHKTIIPSEAHAKVSFRLVADQQPAEVHRQFAEYVRDHTPPGVTATIHTEGPGVRPCHTPLESPALQAVLTAMGRAFEAPVLTSREGGSGPEADLGEILAAPVVFLGVMRPGDRFHAPNERASVPLLLKGAEAAAYLWEELAATPAPAR